MDNPPLQSIETLHHLSSWNWKTYGKPGSYFIYLNGHADSFGKVKISITNEQERDLELYAKIVGKYEVNNGRGVNIMIGIDLTYHSLIQEYVDFRRQTTSAFMHAWMSPKYVQEVLMELKIIQRFHFKTSYGNTLKLIQFNISDFNYYHFYIDEKLKINTVESGEIKSLINKYEKERTCITILEEDNKVLVADELKIK